jgi:HK97 gp10 family phage protein
MFTITPSPGNARVFKITSRMTITSKTGMRQGLYKFGSLLRDDLRINILKKPKSGKEYLIRKGGRRFRHIASADGETPASITGKLRKSVEFKVNGANELRFGYDNSVEYGKYLEEGTRKMNPKPGLLNTINKNQVKGVNLIGNEVMKRMTT